MRNGLPLLPPPKTRPEKPQTPADPKELEIRPNEEGKIQPSFRGQPWLDVLEWVAKISNCSLDWQEHPGDFLNLQTHRPYTVPEIRDLINRHLLDPGDRRRRKGKSSASSTGKRSIRAWSPGVKPEDLETLMPHDFVKVSLALDWMIAENAVTELKPMLSPNGLIGPSNHKPRRGDGLRLQPLAALENARGGAIDPRPGSPRPSVQNEAYAGR